MDPRVTELHCIMPTANLGSVMTNGILSYERAAKLPHHSVALQPVQSPGHRQPNNSTAIASGLPLRLLIPSSNRTR